MGFARRHLDHEAQRLAHGAVDAHVLRRNLVALARMPDVALVLAVLDCEYQSHIWHPRQRHEVSPQHVSVNRAMREPLRFVIEVAPRKPHYKPPLDPLHYSK